MKSAKDPRHLKRRETVQNLFSLGFAAQDTKDQAREIFKKKENLDKLIEGAAPQWPIDKLNHIDLAILRLATYEITNTDTPKKVVIDEAVELAKEFGGENSPSFINGVLGKIVEDIEKNTNENK
jgi:N utilization substance protein B